MAVVVVWEQQGPQGKGWRKEMVATLEFRQEILFFTLIFNNIKWFLHVVSIFLSDVLRSVAYYIYRTKSWWHPRESRTYSKRIWTNSFFIINYYYYYYYFGYIKPRNSKTYTKTTRKISRKRRVFFTDHNNVT
jgi:hypothetical protein